MSDMFYFRSGQASIWAQPDGSNTAEYYLGCHEMGDITESEGDFTPLYCPDPAQTDKFVIRDYVRGQPDLPTTEIIVPVGKTLDYLEEWDCPGNIILLKQSTGRRDLWTNWDRAHLLYYASRTGRTYSAMAARSPENNEESMVTIPFTFLTHEILVQLEGARYSTAETANVLASAFVHDTRCQDIDGPRVKRCQYGVVTGAAAVAAEALLMVTADNGTTWTNSATDPFAVGEDIGAAIYVQLDEDTRRIVVGRSTTDVAAPAEVAYSDDDGATWTLADVGATNGEFITAMDAVDFYHIWAVTDLGYIYFSDDGGVTWTAQESGTITAVDYLDIRMLNAQYGIAVGEANEVAFTSNGGNTWSAVTGPSAGGNLTTVEIVTRKRYFVGNDDGELWSTDDGGLTWTQKTFSGANAGTTQMVRFESEMVGFMIHDTAAPVGRMFRTKDGGYTWELTTVPTNVGLTSLVVCGANHVYLTGLATAGPLSYIAQMESI